MANAIPLDVLAHLQALKFRGVGPIPCQQNSINVSHNIVEHNQYAVAGGEIENTCRKSGRFSFKCMFRGGISGFRNLYPQTFRDFWNACLDRTTGPLQHPEFGLVDVKTEHFDVQFDPTRRDGVDVDVVWVETIDKGLSLDITTSSPITYAVGLAGNLENVSAGNVAVPEYDDGSGMSLKQALNKIKGTIMLAEMSISNTLSDIGNSINALNDMIDTLQNVATTNPANWDVVKSLKAIEAALQQTAKQVGATKAKQRVGIRTTTTKARFPLLAAGYGMKKEDFIKLNPMVAIYDEVPSGSTVFVYEN